MSGVSATRIDVYELEHVSPATADAYDSTRLRPPLHTIQ